MNSISRVCSNCPDICCSCCKDFKVKLKDQLTLCDTIHHSWDCQLQQNRETFAEKEAVIKALVEGARVMLDGWGDEDNHIKLKEALKLAEERKK